MAYFFKNFVGEKDLPSELKKQVLMYMVNLSFREEKKIDLPIKKQSLKDSSEKINTEEIFLEEHQKNR